MEKTTKNMIFLATYSIILYWLLSNIRYITTGISAIRDILSPIFIGGILAFILNQLLNFIEEEILEYLFRNRPSLYKKKRILSIILTYLITSIIILSILLFIVPQIILSTQVLIEKFPRYAEGFQVNMNELLISLGLSHGGLNNILGSWQEIISNFAELAASTVDKVFDLTINFATGIANLFIGLIFSVYILIYKEKLIGIGNKLLNLFATPKTAQRITDFIEEINLIFTGFISGQLIEAFILGGMCFLGMNILDLPYAPLVSVLIGVTSLIPLLGAFIGAIPSALIIFLENPMQALIFILFLIIIQQIEGNFIYPKVVGNAVGLDGFWVLLAIIVGGNAFGIVGVFLGVPFMAVIYTLIRQFTNKAYVQKKKN